MTILAIWFIGAIVSLLAFKWMKDVQFRATFDEDGVKILASIFWPVVVIVEVADIVTTLSDKFVDNVNHNENTLWHKLCEKFGKVYRKYL